jgi:hypothetical protein
MRLLFAVAFLFTANFADETPGKRYGVATDLKTYPQSTPQETLASIIKAIENKRIDYLVAQLADPPYIDERVQRLYAGKVEAQIDETKTKMDAAALKLLQRFQKDGECKSDKDSAIVQLKDNKERAIHLRRVGERWYLLNNSKGAE